MLKPNRFFLLILCPFAFCWSSNKHVIGAVPGAGFFANVLSVLGHINWSLRHNKSPVVYWDHRCEYYTPEGYNGSYNAWEYYFEPLTPVQYEDGDYIHASYVNPDGQCLCGNVKLSKDFCTTIHAYLLKPFIRLNHYMQQKVDDFFDAHMRGHHTIGIHVRGTDKYKEVKPVAPELLLQTAQALATPETQFFIATDEEALLELAQKTLQGKVLWYDSHRSRTKEPVHLQSYPNKASLGEEVLIEVMLFTRCDQFVHTCSNISAAVLFFNPNIQNVCLTAP
jgi:hypothetical protein